LEVSLAEKTHPYISGSGAITSAVNLLRKNFPAKVTADTLKKLSIAPNNESYLLNILRFIGVIDAEGNKTDKATATFNKHDDTEFQQAFEKIVKEAYSELFGLRGEDAWTLDDNALISFFRNADQTSDLVGRRQAGTFQSLAALAGHGELPKPKASKEPRIKNEKAKASIQSEAVVQAKGTGGPGQPGQRDFGLTVRIEVNLPQAADQDTYDRIFRSIRENLLNGK
jgi:hypothetical protein